MPRSVPPRPSLEYVRKEAKHLLAAHRSGDASVCDVLRLHHRFQGASDSDILAADVSLQQAQHALAKEYGFDSWAELKSQVNQRGPVSKSGRAFSDGREPYGHRLTEELPPSHAARWLAQNCEEGSSSLIVDAGCGDGRNTAFLIAEGFNVVAVDTAEANLETTYNKVEREGLRTDRLRCLQADLVGRIPLEAESCSAVLDVYVLGAIFSFDGPDGARRYVSNVQCVLEPEGLFVLEFESWDNPPLSPDGLLKRLEELLGEGFRIEHSEVVPPDYWHKMEIRPEFSKVDRPEPPDALFAVASKR